LRARTFRIAKRRPPDARFSLPRQAGQVRHRDVDFGRCEIAQQLGDQRDLRAPA
jgi:hypothetical protein